MFGGRRSSILGIGITINKGPRNPTPSRNTYREAGVDIDAGNQFVRRIAPLAAATRRPGGDVEIGGFGAFFDLKDAGYEDPILVAATDGVGTKLLIARDVNRHHTVGMDLVAMCVNDLVVQGAEPLFFLDYLATGKLDPVAGEAVVNGIADACVEAGCALIGGETAELPGLYTKSEYDLAGFAVGAVERGTQITGERVRPGDVVLGLASNGLHSNGFSLVRSIVAQVSLSYADPAPFDPGRSLGHALLEPTRLYVKSCLAAVRSNLVHALAHITGGGLADNLARVLPEDVRAEIDATSWPVPSVFGWLVNEGNVPLSDALQTFNMGVGMTVVVAARQEGKAIRFFEDQGETVFRIGLIVDKAEEGPSVAIDGDIKL